MGRKTVFVAMSGGVDSSVTAAILVERGFNVVGITFRLWGKGSDRSCCSLEAVMDARSVAYKLGIPHYVWNFEGEFLRQVVDVFAKEYADGLTPNPCLLCNRYIKFEHFLKRALALGADYIATGHYARIAFDDSTGRFKLLRAVDKGKDQSYALYMLTQDVMRFLLLPIGEMRKEDVRALARQLGLKVAEKRESQDLCFAPDDEYQSIVVERYPSAGARGPLMYVDGSILGLHRGIAYYTVGQRRRISIRSPSGKPLYVVAIDPDTKTVIVGERSCLEVSEAELSEVNLVSGEIPKEPFKCTVMHRYRSKEATATVSVVKSDDGLSALVRWDEPQIGVAPGQAVVFYNGDEVLGGGKVMRVRLKNFPRHINIKTILN